MARTVMVEVRKRGFFGHLFKWTFVLFNVLMAAWMISYWVTVSDQITNAGSEAARAGGAIGATLATGTIAFFWVAGAVVLGLFTMLTRGRKYITTETID